VELTAEQDHQCILNFLHISSLRAGPDSDPASPHAANFDESKANPYPALPDPLVLDDKGQFMAEVAAGPVYKLLGKKGLGATEMPPIGTSLIAGDLAFRQHEGGHTDVPNWPAFLQFASRYMSRN
jgi:hypothetical protein